MNLVPGDTFDVIFLSEKEGMIDLTDGMVIAGLQLVVTCTKYKVFIRF
jgi:hypothetical protein